MSKRYSDEFKESVIKKMIPPNPTSIQQLCRETGVSDVTLYKWRKSFRNKGVVVPGDKSKPENWNAGAKLSVVIETASFNEVDPYARFCGQTGACGLPLTRKELAFAGAD